MPENKQEVEQECTQARRDELVMEQLPQVKYIARRIHERLPKHVAMEDLVHAGIVGLLDAANKFDNEKHVQFQSYAKFRIRGAILDSLRDLDWSPRDLRRKAREIEAAEMRVLARTGHVADEQELAEELGLEIAELRDTRRELDGLGITSLQESPVDGLHEEREIVVQSHEDGPLELFLREESRGRVAQAIGTLPERERQVLSLYYFEELTMKEVGAVLGVGESRVSQIHSQALLRLRQKLQPPHRDYPLRGMQGEAAWISY